jgi:hypothetical protein
VEQCENLVKFSISEDILTLENLVRYLENIVFGAIVKRSQDGFHIKFFIEDGKVSFVPNGTKVYDLYKYL